MTTLGRLLLCAAVGFGAVATIGVGCASDEPAAVADPVAASRDQLRDAIVSEFDATYARLAASQLAEHPIGNAIAELPADGEATVLLGEVYGRIGYTPVFSSADGTPSPRIDWVVGALAGAAAHGLEPAAFVPEHLETLVATQRQLARAAAALPPLAATREERRALADSLAAVADPAAGDPAVAALAALLDPAREPVPGLEELRRLHRDHLAVRAAAAGHAALLDLAVLDGVVRYALRQRFANTDAVDTKLADDAKAELIASRTTAFVEALRATSTEGEVAALFDTLPPALPQYPLLLQARARYADIVANGGWATIEPRSVRRGAAGPTVEQLKQRLSIEGYYDGPVDDVFDAGFEEAFRLYQRTHQLEEDGASSRAFWESINVDAEQRLAQIDLTLQRWRESRVGDDTDYILVNIPDFHAEVWRGGERAMRFRVVVGNTQRVCDPRRRRMVYANATPLQSSVLDTVVVNPFWNVPRRIVEEELLPALERDPTYFERSGFERTSEDSSNVRQLPGRTNPLGRVKFLFPNPHATYLHDTSRPQYFDFPVRAFSHGCMRVQDPMALLEHLLTHDGQYNARDIERALGRTYERPYTLNKPVPIHVEYYVVRIDDEGHVNFLSDIYRYDRERLDPSFVPNERCAPPPVGARLVLGDGHTVMYRDAEGNRYTRDQWEYVQSGGTLEQRSDGTFADPPREATPADPVAADDFGP